MAGHPLHLPWISPCRVHKNCEGVSYIPKYLYILQVTPAGFTFAIWGVIYTWQALWIIYAWTFVFRPKMPRTIFTGVYVGYTLVSATNITWIYVWGNLHITAACVLLFLFNIFFYPTLGMLVGYFYKIREKPHCADTVLTWIFPINGLFLYATWTTIASLINFAAALQYSGSDVSATNSATVSLSLLLVTVLVYFVLENTVLYRVLRYVLSVYPVVIWALTGVLSIHWGVEGEERNSRFALGLLIVTIVLFIVRIIVVVIFGVVRPLCKVKTPAKV